MWLHQSLKQVALLLIHIPASNGHKWMPIRPVLIPVVSQTAAMCPGHKTDYMWHWASKRQAAYIRCPDFRHQASKHQSLPTLSSMILRLSVLGSPQNYIAVSGSPPPLSAKSPCVTTANFHARFQPATLPRLSSAPTHLPSSRTVEHDQGRTHGGRGARAPPWDLKNTIFSGFLPLNYVICIFEVCFF